MLSKFISLTLIAMPDLVITWLKKTNKNWTVGRPGNEAISPLNSVYSTECKLKTKNGGCMGTRLAVHCVLLK